MGRPGSDMFKETTQVAAIDVSHKLEASQKIEGLVEGRGDLVGVEPNDIDYGVIQEYDG